MLEFLKELGMSDAFRVFFISMLPVVELRGGIPAGALMGLGPLETFILCVIGNMLPVPFIVVLWKKVVALFKRGKIKELFERIQAKADKKLATVDKLEFWGLFIFVAIPLPGTGAWTGALIAATLDMKLKKAFPPILLGVLAAGLIMTIISYGASSIITSIF